VLTSEQVAVECGPQATQMHLLGQRGCVADPDSLERLICSEADLHGLGDFTIIFEDFAFYLLFFFLECVIPGFRTLVVCCVEKPDSHL
jgi:hypothetical protein